MVTFKQKEFSTPTTRIIFKAKQTGNMVANKLKLAQPKSKIKIARESITLRKNLQPEAIKSKAVDTALNAIRKVENATYQPGAVVDKGIKTALTSPVGAAMYGTATYYAPGLPGISGVAAATEAAARKIPAYRKLVNNWLAPLGEAYEKTPVSRKLKGFDSYKFHQLVSMIPSH